MSDYAAGALEQRTTRFNAGIAQTIRIHRLQDKINQYNMNPISYNEHEGNWNYELIISCLESLYKEAEAKLNVESRKKYYELYKIVHDALEEYPIYQTVKTVNSGAKSKFNESYWKIFKKLLFKYESHIRGLLDDVGLNNPDYGEDEDEL